MSMTVNSVGYPSSYGTPGLGQAIQSGLTLTSGMASLGSMLLQSLQSGASVANPQTSMLGQPNGLGNSPIAGLLQSVVQLLQAVTPLLQALGNRMQPNQTAMQFSNQLGGFNNPMLGNQQFGNPQFGNPQFGAPQFGAPQFGTPQFGNQQFGNPVLGTPAYGAQPYSNLTSFSVNSPAQFGNMTPQAALGWAQAYGGPNMQQSDIQQGMNLYSIFNSGSRMF
jgi:hypothetical protein